jgi:hypothetical protein
MNKQKGFLDFHRMIEDTVLALIIFGAVVGAITALILFFGLPWIWDIIKPILHEMTK